MANENHLHQLSFNEEILLIRRVCAEAARGVWEYVPTIAQRAQAEAKRLDTLAMSGGLAPTLSLLHLADLRQRKNEAEDAWLEARVALPGDHTAINNRLYFLRREMAPPKQQPEGTTTKLYHPLDRRHPSWD